MPAASDTPLARWIGVDRTHPGAVWRLAAYVLAVFVGAAVASAVLSPVASALFALTGRHLLGYAWINLAGVAVAHLALLRWVERRGWDTVQLTRRAARPSLLTFGALLGVVAIGVPAVLLLLAGPLRAVPAPAGSWWAAAGSSALSLAPAALFEELLLRGYPFAVLRAAGGPLVALLVTSLVFGLLHLQNPGATAGSVAVVTLAGIFLGGVLLATGSLWAAFTAHLAWNWTLAGLLHAAVSGLPSATPGYRVVDAGPDWLTGGAWGPEGGAPAAAAMLVVLTILWRRGRRSTPTEPLDARPDGRGSF